MAEEPLSQEEIDALVRGESGSSGGDAGLPPTSRDGSSPGEGDEHPLDEDQLDALGEFFNIAMGRAATVLSTILGRDVEITTPRVSWIDWKEMVSSHPVPCVVVWVEFKEGLEGSTVLVLSQRDANLVANIMDEEERDLEEPLDEYRQSVVGEAVNQMVGGAVYAMSEMLGLEMSIQPPRIQVLDFSSGDETPPAPSYGEGDLVQIAFEFRVDDLLKSEMIQLMPVGFAQALADMILQEDEEVELPREEERVAERGESGEAGPPTTASEEEVEVRRAEFLPLGGGAGGDRSEEDNIRLLLDIELEVSVELGRTRMRIKDVLSLGEGSIIELDKVVGEPVEIYANRKLIARGEVVVIDEDFGVRVTEIVRKQP
ncbi:MAG: flagellar motor switch phosphatase FliY [Actinomycetota bacterium]|nr:flagellar motor switch phosphatase FliY [Actinomycetota bacterium]MDI7251173.1 flagellar motor switch phosphatase FliY [Actinomycetota bacterium]